MKEHNHDVEALTASWIEIMVVLAANPPVMVEALTASWIEIACKLPYAFTISSKPLRLRGLKLAIAIVFYTVTQSKPLRLRGLKWMIVLVLLLQVMVEALTASWIEISRVGCIGCPMAGRSPYGFVD